MSQIINTNIPSLTSQRNLSGTNGSLATSLQRLSSGLRINSAKDDAAGLAISERFTAQIRGLDQAKRNSNDGISLAQSAEGALASSGDILQRIRELAVQSANATNSSSDRKALNDEVNELTAELNRIAQTTEFNGRKLLDGSFTSADFQVGANAGQTITVTSSNFSTSAYGNYRIGGQAPTDKLNGSGDLTLGSTPNAIMAQGKVGASAIAAGTLTINGSYGNKDVAYDAAMSARDMAAKINSYTEDTGVKASARTEVQLQVAAGNSYELKLASNNDPAQAVSLSFTVGDTLNADGLGAAVNAFNDMAAKTGVTAKVNADGTGIILTNANGNDIKLLNDSTAANTITVTDVAGGALVGGAGAAIAGKAGAGAFGTDDLVITGQITLDSDKSFSALDTNGAAAGTGFLNINTAAASQLQTVAQNDVSTVDSANRTLAIVDAALSAINSQRAKYGAIQSRFQSTIDNLSISSENLSASRSRIRDTDFASETANLTRAQILQQAGTAMLAQANALPQNVLSLIR